MFDAAKQRQLEIVDEPFRVAVNPRAASQASPRIRLADTSISVGDRGGQIIATRLILSTDGLTDCTLKLPDDDELISVKLDGQPALYTPIDGNRWRVVLGAADLPQLMEIVSRSASGNSDTLRHELRRPLLVVADRPVPADVSLWTVIAPVQSAGTRVGVSPLDQAALRLDRLASIVESAYPVAAEAPEPDGDNWLLAWSSIVRDILGQAQQARLQPGVRPAAAQISRTSEEQLDRTIKRLEAWLLQVGKPADGATTTNPSAPSLAVSPWRSPIPGDMSVACYVAEGGADRFAFDPVRTSSNQLPPSILPILVIAGLAAILAWTIRSPIVADFLCRWPHAMGILVGIGWWAWLSPSWFGLVIVAASVWRSLRFDWPGRSYRAEASTVLRSTRTH
jgi:hypothetical protein